MITGPWSYQTLRAAMLALDEYRHDYGYDETDRVGTFAENGGEWLLYIHAPDVEPPTWPFTLTEVQADEYGWLLPA